MKGIIRRITMTLETCKSPILPSFVAMYKILTEMLKIIEEIINIISIYLPKFNDFDLLMISPDKNSN